MSFYRREAGPRRQRGAIGLMAAAVMALVILCIVVALDTGRLYMQKQNLQRVADMAALDSVAGANLMDGGGSPSLQGLAEESASLNDFPVSNGVREIITVQGTVEVIDGVNRFVPSSDGRGSAVQVLARHRVPTSLVANLARLFEMLAPDDDGEIRSHIWLEAEAVARQPGVVAFSAGTSLLTADLSGSPLLGPVLQGLLGSEVDISAVSFTGLANLGISLLDLIQASPNVGTMDELLDLPLAIGGDDGLVSLAISALEAGASGGQVLTASSRQALEALTLVSLGDITLGELLSINTPDGDRSHALETLISVGELLNSAIFLANQESAVSIPGLEVTLGRLVMADITLEIIQPPQIAIGPPGCIEGYAPPCSIADADGRYWQTQATPAQLDLELDLAVDLIGLARLSLDLELTGANGVAGVERVERLLDQGYRLEVGAMTSPLGVDAGIELTLLPDFEGLLTLSVETEEGTTSGIVPGGYVSNGVDWPTDSDGLAGTTLSSGLDGVGGFLDALLSGLNVTISLGPDAEQEESCSGFLGCLIGGVVDLLSPVLDVVNDLLGFVVDDLLDLSSSLGAILANLTTEVLAPLIEPLLEALGISVAEVEVRIIEVQVGGAELAL
ncbi:pilus assembly protein TadG-related protein [Halomonas salifodinae]|uniref:pilus assembly protein TadG-related protein n=1 Tax=Halomonas salifodinae TaxID=438745 RepID=UPI0033AD35DE